MDNFHLISKYAICYSIYFLILFIGKTEHSCRLFHAGVPANNSGILLGVHLAGILWLGVVPFFILQHATNDIVFGLESPTILQLSCLVVLLLASIAIASIDTGKTNTAKPLQPRADLFSKTFVRQYTLYRTVFLMCYELFFRGYLLSDTIQRTGVVASISLNVALYVLLHVFNDKKEMIACIPFGIILCSLCIWFGAAWPAILIHTVFAIVYELKLLKKNLFTINNMRYENIRHRFFGLHRE